MLQTYPKYKSDDVQAELFHRGVGKRRASHQSSEHDLEEHITEWANMTWFLLTLGGVCLQKRLASRWKQMQLQNNTATAGSTSGIAATGNLLQSHNSLAQSQNTLAAASSLTSISTIPAVSLYSLYSCSTSSGRGSLLHPSTISLTTIVPVPQQDLQYCPVSQ